MKNESIERQFRSEKKESAPLVRQSFRIPVFEKEIIQVLIKQKKYLVFNISQGGVGISSDNLPDLKSDEILTGCELILQKERFKGLTGKIIHYSASASGPLEHGIHGLILRRNKAKP